MYQIKIHTLLNHINFLKVLRKIQKKNDMSTTFLQQILSDKLLLVVIVGAKK